MTERLHIHLTVNTGNLFENPAEFDVETSATNLCLLVTDEIRKVYPAAEVQVRYQVASGRERVAQVWQSGTRIDETECIRIERIVKDIRNQVASQSERWAV